MNAADSLTAHEQDMLAALGNAFAKRNRQLYLVGGTVRDIVMGFPRDGDWDFATDAPPEETNQILRSLPGDTVVWGQGEKFGTVAADWSNQYDSACPSFKIEVTTFRTERYSAHSRKPVVAWGQSLDEDLSRRDFTINAMALHPTTLDIYDPFKGESSITQRELTAVGDANERFAEDPLRMLRAIRFATRFSWDIEIRTWQSLKGNTERMQIISRERIRDELEKILACRNVLFGLDLVRMSKLLDPVLPALGEAIARMYFFEVERCRSREARWAALLWGGNCRELLEELRQPHDLQRRVFAITRGASSLNLWRPTWRHGEVRQMIREIGGTFRDKDAIVRQAFEVSAAMWPDSEDRLKQLQILVMSLGDVHGMDSPIGGDQLQAMFPDLTPGPWIGQVKEWLLQDVLFDRYHQADVEEAEAMARIYVAAIQGTPA